MKEVTAASFNLGCCAGVSCGPPLHVANGVVRGAVFQFGDVAAYSCFGGYAMEGVGRSRCLENGTWTPPPKCRGRGGEKHSVFTIGTDCLTPPPLNTPPSPGSTLLPASTDTGSAARKSPSDCLDDLHCEAPPTPRWSWSSSSRDLCVSLNNSWQQLPVQLQLCFFAPVIFLPLELRTSSFHLILPSL